jgi:outer membrane protein assembly factor BamB
MPLEYTEEDEAVVREISAKHKAVSAAAQTTRLSELVVWRRKLGGVKFALVPALDTRPNPAVTESRVIASLFSPGGLAAVDRNTGHLAWRIQTPPFGHSSVLVEGEVVFAATTTTLQAIDSRSGREIWVSCPYGEDRGWIASSPTVHGGQLFIGGAGDRIYCLNAHSGAFRWWHQVSRDQRHNVVSVPTIAGDLVIVVSTAAVAVAYSLKDGKQVWRRKLDGPSIREALVVGGRLVITTSSSLYIVSPSDGSLVKRRSWRGREIDAVARSEDTVFVRIRKESRFRGRKYDYTTVITEDHDERLVALRDGDTVFERPAPVYLEGLRWSPETRLLYESRYDGLGILDPNTGERLVNLPLRRGGHLGLVEVRDGIIYALKQGGELLALRHPQLHTQRKSGRAGRAHG